MARFRDYGYGREYPRRGYYRPSYWGWGPYYTRPGYWPPYEPFAYPPYDYGYTPRLPPEESPTYGRGGDRALRRWARRHGYDVGYTLPPVRRGERWGRGRGQGTRGYAREYPAGW